MPEDFANGLVGIVDDGCGQRACGIGHLDGLDEVVAPSGLRDREEELTVELEALLVDGSDIGRKSTDRDAEMALDQMLAERRCMGRAPARAGKDKVRRLALEATQELSQRSFERLRLLPHGVGAFLPVRFHVDAVVAHRDRPGAVRPRCKDSAALRANCSAPATASPRGATR